jgi:hypothetical protein
LLDHIDESPTPAAMSGEGWYSGYGGYGGYGGFSGYQGTGGTSGEELLRPSPYSVYEDPVDDFLDNFPSRFTSSETARHLAMSGTPGVEDFGARRGLIADMISTADPMNMGNSRRGARIMLHEIDVDPQGFSMLLQAHAGVQDVDRLMGDLEAQCYAELMDVVLSGPMIPHEGIGSTGMVSGVTMPGAWPSIMVGDEGFGGFGLLPGVTADTMAPGMTPSMADPRAGAQAGPYWQRGDRSEGQGAFGERYPSADRDSRQEDHVYGPSNDADGRPDNRRRRGNRGCNAGEQDGSSGQPAMYPAYFGWGRS